MDRKSPEYMICPCHKITRAEVAAIIESENIRSLKDLSAYGIAGDKCGGCREDLERLIYSINGQDENPYD